jgi:hypothetical protein
MATAAKLVKTDVNSVIEPQRFALRHYTVGEIAALWNLSDDAVRKIFENEPGVVAIRDARPTVRKRRYTTLRIPEDVLARVHRRLSKV